MQREADLPMDFASVTEESGRGSSASVSSPSDSHRADTIARGPSVPVRRFVFVVAALCVFVMVGMAQVWIRLRIVRMGYDLSAETRKAEKLQRLEHKLEVEQALLRRPERIRAVAASRLGLREVRRGEVTVIHRGGGGARGGF